MPNGHGGSRLGSGQKKKPLADKMLDGNVAAIERLITQMGRMS